MQKKVFKKKYFQNTHLAVTATRTNAEILKF